MMGFIILVISLYLISLVCGNHFRYERKLWEDHSLPFPVAVHQLNQDEEMRLQRKMMSLNSVDPELTPLYPGYGTHFSYIWVGTPPQRQSVIVDTGSQFTGFPCTGCSQCGSHTDKYFDPKNSSTARVCNPSTPQCSISQSYSEGSSWKGYKVTDKVYVGGLSKNSVPKGASYALDLTFACQTSETGLFRTQLADGIMGMSMGETTVPFQLKKNGLTANSMFALCFRVGGGILTLGGVDQRIHTNSINYVNMVPLNGLYGVILLDVAFETSTGSVTSIPNIKQIISRSTGTIVDSGTTDTYFPSSILKVFTDEFKKISGIIYNSAGVVLTKEQLNKLPNIRFTLKGVETNQTVTVTMPWSNYADSIGNNKYAFRIYLTEPKEFILGANFMTGLNIVFDSDNRRIGIARSQCRYDDYITPPSELVPPKFLPPPPPPKGNKGVCELVPASPCSASCEEIPDNSGSIAKGVQNWRNICPKNVTGSGAGPKNCHITCYGTKQSRAKYLGCPDKPWSECSASCQQIRFVVTKQTFMTDNNMVTNHQKRYLQVGTNTTKTGTQCRYGRQTRSCATGACPVAEGDYLVFVDMKVRISPFTWSYVHKEVFYGAFASLFSVTEGSVDLLNDANAEYTNKVKLRFEMRLKQKSYPSKEAFINFAESVPLIVKSKDFREDFIDKLENISVKQFSGIDLDYSMFGWMKAPDIEISNVIVLPKGLASHDKEKLPPSIAIGKESGNIGGSIDTDQPKSFFELPTIDLILFGVALGTLAVLMIVLYMYIRLRQEHAALEKDKVQGGSLRRMWDKFIAMQTGKDNKSTGDKRSNYAYKHLNMQEFSSAVDSGELGIEEDNQLDTDDNNANRR